MVLSLSKYDLVLHEQQHERKEELKIRRKALITTIAIYVVFFIMILFLVVPAQNPPLESLSTGGSDIILGNDASGMNETFELVAAGPPFDKITAPKVASQTPPQPQQQQQISEEQFEDSNDPDAVAINKTPKPKKENTPVTTPTETKTTNTNTTPTPPKREVDKRTLFEKGGGSGGTGGTNTSKGTGNSPGDQGDPNGNKDAHSWTKYGEGTEGTGPGFDLAGRSAIALPPPDCSINQSGFVVVAIDVDKNGKVVSARGGVRGSTLFDANSVSCAENAARKAKFSMKEDAPEIQSGIIRYSFKVK
jgi:outer membrane biosynthesis protein TonB